MKLIRKYSIGTGFILMILWELLLIFQGVELADTGFHLTAFTFIFEDSYSVQYSMSFWLSDICGHLWMSIWPSGGLLWGRIGWMVVINCALILYFLLLKPELGVQKTLLGLGITTIFILQGGPECLNYDMFSILGYSIAVTLLYKGLSCNKTVPLITSGFILGITVFFKLTNLSGLIILLMIPFSVYLNKKTFSHSFKLSFIYLISFIVGIGAILLLINFTGHLDLFLENLSFISNMTKDSEASHGFIPLFTSYFSGYLNAVIILVFFIGLIWIYIRLSNKYTSIFKDKHIVYYYLGVVVFTAFLMIAYEKVFWSKIRYLFIGLMLLAGVFSILDKTKTKQSRLLSFAGLLILLIAPLGSDSGLEKSIFGMWILSPIVLTNLNLNRYLSLLKVKITALQVNTVQKILMIIILVSSVFFAWQSTYFDVGSRIKKTYPIKHPKMKYIYTSKERADDINELIAEAFPKIKNEEYLLSFIEIPMVNYLSNKKPFIFTSWPKLYYNPKAFEKKLYEALKKRKKLPAIIRQKQNTMLNNWPSEQAEVNYLDYPTDLSKWPKHGRILNEFIKKYKYKMEWENEMFQLLISK